ncbi:MAG TPA: SDR family NAD(P)-dependent oxidoreductase, partial [Candidatus Xenobia bacterium]
MSDPTAERLERALLAIQKLRAKVADLQAASHEAVAIIGLGCQYPGGVHDGESFWQLLVDEVDAVVEIPAERWPHREEDAPGTRWAGLLDWHRIQGFDPAFFGMAPREAVKLDPQQRLLLEVSWEALENAGLAADRLMGSKTGVFVGVYPSEYGGRQEWVRGPWEAYDTLGNNTSVAAGRVSFVLGLQGPCLALDTACSSSLVAVHLAVESLRTGQCDMALAGGVHLMLTRSRMEAVASLQALSPDGRCKAFDALADGFVRAEGCGIVVLKRLSQAQRDGDRILAVIRGSAINQDGRSTGLTTPNVLSQQLLFETALTDAGVSHEAVGFIEAHGTGTSLGDPIEVTALKAVYGRARATGLPCLLGTVKTNIGHSEAAAGIAGLIKVALCLQHERIPRHLHLKTLNPRIDFTGTPFRIPVQAQPWPRGEQPRVAGVSSFGVSGTNAHVILEEAPLEAVTSTAATRPLHLLALSARDEGALNAQASQYARFLPAHADLSLLDVCHTAGVGRTHFRHRLAVVAASPEQVAADLTSGTFAQGESEAPPRVAFLFTGQGSQYAGMGQALYDSEPVFRDSVDRCAAILAPLPLLSLLYGETPGIDETQNTQPALFVLEYALTELWRSWGIVPVAVLGHSIGEVVAAHVAGVFSLEDALALVAARGRLMGALPKGGAMVSVRADEARVRAVLDGVSLAAINGPQSVVVSGDEAAVVQVAARLQAEGVETKRLTVSHAFHSALMDPMLAEFERVASGIRYHTPRLPLVSNLTGALAGDEVATPAYWVRHVREAVRFADGMQTLSAQHVDVFLEVGPHPQLSGMGAGCIETTAAWLPSLRSGKDEWRIMLGSLGQLYARGAAVDWAGFDRPYPARKAALPTYPFQRQRHWLEVRDASEGSERTFADWLYSIAWRPASPPQETVEWHGPWLVLGKSEVAVRLADHLRERGAQPVLSLDEHLQTGATPLRGVVCLWGLEGESPDLMASQERLCGGVLHLVQGLVGAGISDLPALWLVTQGAQSVQDEAPSLPQAPLWGLGRVLQREHPELRGRLVDLDPAASDPLPALLLELGAADPEDQVAWRTGQRHVPRLVQATVGSTPAGEVRSDATYLVTGGLGAIGRRVAEWLVAQGGRHLVLTSRRVPEGEALSWVDPLRAIGAEVQVSAVDVSRADQVEALFGRMAATMPPLAGVLHLAGVLDDGTLASQTWERFATVLAPKALGAWHLHRATEKLALDFFVLFSAATSLLGNPGQGNYAAANAFLDGLAAWRQAHGLPGVAINWGAWATGMVATLEEAHRQRMAVHGWSLMEAENGLAWLGRLLRHHGEVAVLPVDWQRMASRFEGATPPFLSEVMPAAEKLARVDKAHSHSELLVRLQAAAPDRQRDLLVDLIQAQVARVVGLGSPSEVRTRQSLKDMGVDSLMAVELRNALGGALAQKLPATLAFDHPTVERMADYLLGRLSLAAPVSRPVPVPVVANEGIAVIGLGCRFPGGASSPKAFWQLLADGVDAITEVPPERWDAAAFYDPDPDAPGKMVTRWGGFLPDVDRFDPAFFGIAPREAVSMDPQQRLLLETSWEALEHAGLVPAALEGSRTGVFVGIVLSEYHDLLRDAGRVDAWTGTGSAYSVAAGRLSYVLGLQGPSLAVDTACSSSLMALHLACQSLQHGECDLALAGGVNLTLTPDVTVYVSKMHAASPTGRCHTFDAAADGYVRSDGCGMVVLKRLSAALRDGDPVLAVVRGSAANQDGRSSGLTAPNGPAQEAVISEALARAGVAPARVGYVECHGTGTPLGDPIELQALGAVLGQDRPADHPVLVGAVKTNIGHAEGAAGVAGFIKAVLALQHGAIPPHLHFNEPSPHIPWDQLRVKVATGLQPWPADPGPRVAGVSSFGFSGTNVHMIVEEAPVQTVASAELPRPMVLPLSGHSAAALQQAAAEWAEVLQSSDTVGDLLYTAAVRRTHHPHRLAVVGNSAADLVAGLQAFAQGRSYPGLVSGQADVEQRPRVVFVFPGQGSQWLGMVRELYLREPAFKTALDECDQAVQAEAGWSVVAMLQADTG